MLQAGRELDFAQEPVGAERGCELGTQHLDRHLAMVLAVFSHEHCRHAALADLSIDVVGMLYRGA